MRSFWLVLVNRGFGMTSAIGFSCIIMVTWEGITTAFQSGLVNGGPSGLLYGFLFVWAGNILQALVISELASMIPISGGQYNWVSVLAPPAHAKFLSYLTGWMTIISWQVGFTSCAYLGGTMIEGLIILNYDSYEPQRWQGTLLFYAVIVVYLFINVGLARLLPAIESGILVIHILGFLGIMISLVYLAPHSSAEDVFTAFGNYGGWSPDSLSFCIGLATSMYAFLGLDATGHIAEEVKDAIRVVPQSIVWSVMINGILGFAMTIALLFCLGDIDAALNTETGFPYIEIYTNATGSTAKGTIMSSVIAVTVVFASVSALATASRMTWAFARENGLPGSRYLSRVEPNTALPLYSIGICTIISFLLGLINICSTTAFNAMISLAIASFYSSFVVSACVMLHKRLTTPDSEIIWGPFKIGRAGVPVTILSIIYSVIGIFFSFWPPTSTVTPETMNWSIFVYGIVLIFCFAFWLAYGRHHYRGPIMEIEPGQFGA